MDKYSELWQALKETVALLSMGIIAGFLVWNLAKLLYLLYGSNN